MTTRLNEIKLEGNEIQSYLETFQSNLDGNDQQTITLIQEADENDEEEEEGTYFVDQSGNYYYQGSKDSEPVLAEPPDGENIQFIVEDDENSIEQADAIENEIVSAQITTNTTKSRKQTMVSKQSESNEFNTLTFDPQGENNDEVCSLVLEYFEKQAPTHVIINKIVICMH